MNRRQAICSLAGVAATVSRMNASGGTRSDSDAANVRWVQRVLERMSRVSTGMTRADLLEVFKTEGGLSTGLQRTYVSQDCPYFKVDVTFVAVGEPERDKQGIVTLAEDSRDQIATISRPYIAFSVTD